VGLFRKRRKVSPLQISEAQLDAVRSRLQSYFPDEISLERDEIVLHSSLLKSSIEDLLRKSALLGDPKLFEFVNSVCYSASDVFYEFKSDEIAQFLSHDFHSYYLHVMYTYQSDVVIRAGALSLMQAFRIKLSNSSKEEEVLEYFSTGDTQFYGFFDRPYSESFDVPVI
jgi:hypothetical protein